jgi:hypothetical protein
MTITTFKPGDSVVYRANQPAIVLDDDGGSKVRIRLADGSGTMFAWRKQLQAQEA